MQQVCGTKVIKNAIDFGFSAVTAAVWPKTLPSEMGPISGSSNGPDVHTGPVSLIPNQIR